MVLGGTGQTSANLQPFLASSASSPTGQRLHSARQRGDSAAFASLVQSKLKQCGRTRRRTSVVPFALNADLLSVAFYSAATAGVLYSATPLLTGKAKQANQGKSDGYGETDAEPEGIKWGVMSVVSFIPFVNWTVSCLEAMSICNLVASSPLHVV